MTDELSNRGGADGLPRYEDNTTMADFDNLPAPLRALLANAPFSYGVKAVRDLLPNMSVQAMLDMAAANIANHIQIAAYHDYGPNHPQARKPEREST